MQIREINRNNNFLQNNIINNNSNFGFNIKDSVKNNGTEQFANEVKKIKSFKNKDNSCFDLKNVLSVTDNSSEKIIPEKDGSYIVDRQTNTRIFFGKSAQKFLSKENYFEKETQIIIPHGASVKIFSDDESFQISEPGAFLIGKGAKAKVDVIKGNVLVIQGDKCPSWYERHAETNIHCRAFNEISQINRLFFEPTELKDKFKSQSLKKLEDNGVVFNYDNKTVKWNDFKEDNSLDKKLSDLGFDASENDRLSAMYKSAFEKRVFGPHSGRFSSEILSKAEYSFLVDTGLCSKLDNGKKDLLWNDISTEKELLSRIEKYKLSDLDTERLKDIWNKTSHSGFDYSGLAWEKNNIVAYLLEGKANLYSGGKTEWISNSTAYPGKNEPFYVGVSNVNAEKTFDKPVSFKQEVRPGETLHRHPVSDEKKQTEVYIVNKGKAALLTLRDGRPYLDIMGQGDMTVINPGLIHCVLAVSGEYEHLCVQVPSAFQYGLIFKDNQGFEKNNLNEDELIETAKELLLQEQNGLVDVKDYIEKKNKINYNFFPSHKS